MGVMLDYHCTYGTAPQEQLPPTAYQEREEMARLAQEQRKQSSSPFCVLPFCHTLEAEALGAEVRFGGAGGARVRSFRYQRPHELRELSLNFDAPRLVETIAACSLLQQRGERVLFQISGPLTILGSLLPPEQLYRSLRKEPEQILKLMQCVSEEVKELILRLEREGISLFSYADPSGGQNLLGPALAARIAAEHTAPFLQQLDAELRQDTLVFLCPKTACALLSCELAQWQEHTLGQELPYRQAALSLQGSLRFVGQSCINRLDYSCEAIKELKLGGQE